MRIAGSEKDCGGAIFVKGGGGGGKGSVVEKGSESFAAAEIKLSVFFHLSPSLRIGTGKVQ